MFDKRHIQDFHDATNLEPHWGYVGRVLPCKNDPGSCEYLDQVYYGHDRSMTYTFVLWGVILGILILWAIGRLARKLVSSSRGADSQVSSEVGKSKSSFASRTAGAIGATSRKYLLRTTPARSIFGNVSRLQVLILAIISAYLIIFTFVGFQYRKWITPVKNSTEFNTRSTLGPWSDRIGALAYALTPFAVALGTRESILSLATGIPYQHFNFLHIWLGRIIFLQSLLHTIGWTIIEAKLYRPQPKTYVNFIKQQYMVFGCVAMAFVSFLFVFSFKPVIRLTGYEFFRKAHYVVAVLYLGACWGHWYQLACWMIASLAIYGLDRGIRLLRTVLIHFGKGDIGTFRFRPAQASVRVFEDAESSVVRLEFEHAHRAWSVGQHFHLCFPALTIWQSHPMTPASMPSANGTQKHVYIIRANKSETARLAALAQPTEAKSLPSTSVILTGPTGCKITPSTNSLVVAGGTGISFALPVFEQALAQAEATNRGAVHLVWTVRHASNLEWIADELTLLRARVARCAAAGSNIDARIKIYITREASNADFSTAKPASVEDSPIVETPASERDDIEFVTEKKDATISVTRSLTESMSQHYTVTQLGDHHPNLIAHSRILDDWSSTASAFGGDMRALASGPVGMGRDLRDGVAALNEPKLAWRGRGGCVGFYWDDRMG